MSSLGLFACNCGNIPTFKRIYRDGRTSQSFIYMSLASEANGRWINGWKVLDEYTGSLHRYITFSIDPVADRPINHDAHQKRGKWSWKKYDQKKLQKFLNENEFTVTNNDALDTTPMLDSYIKQACDARMPNGTKEKNNPLIGGQRQLQI